MNRRGIPVRIKKVGNKKYKYIGKLINSCLTGNIVALTILTDKQNIKVAEALEGINVQIGDLQAINKMLVYSGYEGVGKFVIVFSDFPSDIIVDLSE